MGQSFSHELTDILERRVSARSLEWFNNTKDNVLRSGEEATLLRAYTSATRYLSKNLLNLSADEKARLSVSPGQINFERWRCDDVGRVLFLIGVHGTAVDAYPALVLACYEHGDSSEQTSWLRGLSLLPQADRFLATAIDSCRTNIVPMFEAMACENPYPSSYFPEANFNQLVLKSLFNSIALSRIVGLEKRLNEDLSRMADDYASEREAAGRTVPADIWYVIAPKIKVEGLARVKRYLAHENPDHRHWAAEGLKLRKD